MGEKNRNQQLPGNPRYQPKELADIFGYDELYQKAMDVELATLEVLSEIGIIPEEEYSTLTSEIRQTIKEISTTEVDGIERKITKHDVRALVRAMQQKINSKLNRWVHVPLTSYDPLDTGRSLQFIEAYNHSLKPALIKTTKNLIVMVHENAGKLQIGRTHGQHALPITVGFWLASILNRLIYNWEKLEQASQSLNGKISGAVGAYNAQEALGFNRGGRDFEVLVLEKLGLKPGRISTQILQPEPLAYYLFSCIMLSATFGQFGRDCRHLMRSEIDEVREFFESGQVGSSTMAQKRNPINFENLEGTWLKTKNEFGKVLDTLISEHQRDLVGSSLMRDYPTIVIDLQLQLNTLNRQDEKGRSFLSRIVIDEESCKRNFQKNANFILAEPLYIALQMAGYENDAHELVNHRLMPLAKKGDISLFEALGLEADRDEAVRQAANNIPPEIQEAFLHPENYTGKAKEKALAIADYATSFLEQI